MKIQYFGLCMAACASLLIAQEEAPRREHACWQARSKVEIKFGIAAPSQMPASAAGARILEMVGKRG